MARVTKRGLIGRIGKVIIRRYRKIEVAQSAPGKNSVKQTKSTKKAATIFGQASTLGAQIYLLFNKYTILNLQDGTMRARITTVLREVLSQCFDKATETFTFSLNSFERLNGFDFNADSPLKNSLWLLPESTLSDNTITVTLPELKINEEFIFPKSTNKCIIYLSARMLNLKEGLGSELMDYQTLEVSDTQTILEKQSFSFEVPKGCLCIVSVSLRFYTFFYETSMYNTKAFNPSAICGAFITPGIFEKEAKRYWDDRYSSF